MATRFTRVTVVADGRELDVSLPSSRPVLELVPQVCDLLSVPAGAGNGWILATATGVIDAGRSLDDAGVYDADVLFLTPPAAAPEPPHVEDVVDEVRARLDGNGSEWTGAPRLAGSAALAGVAMLALAWAMLGLPFTAAGRAGAVAVVAIAASLTGALLRERGGVWVLLASVPIWVLTGVVTAAALESRPAGYLFAALAGAGLGLLGYGLAGPRWRGIASAGAVAAVVGLIAVGIYAAGVDGPGTAAIVVVLALFAVGIAPQLAVTGVGLVGMMRAEEKGEPVPADSVRSAVDTGQSVVTGLVAGAALATALSVFVLITARTPASAALGAVTGAAFGLRSRAFTRTGQVLSMLAVAVIAAAVALVALPGWWIDSATGAGWLTAVGLVLVAALALLAGSVHLDELGAARLRRLYDVVDALAVIAVVPLVIGTLGGFDWIRDLAA